jgi:hypothetical protein
MSNTDVEEGLAPRLIVIPGLTGPRKPAERRSGGWFLRFVFGRPGETVVLRGQK